MSDDALLQLAADLGYGAAIEIAGRGPSADLVASRRAFSEQAVDRTPQPWEDLLVRGLCEAGFPAALAFGADCAERLQPIWDELHTGDPGLSHVLRRIRGIAAQTRSRRTQHPRDYELRGLDGRIGETWKAANERSAPTAGLTACGALRSLIQAASRGCVIEFEQDPAAAASTCGWLVQACLRVLASLPPESREDEAAWQGQRLGAYLTGAAQPAPIAYDPQQSYFAWERIGHAKLGEGVVTKARGRELEVRFGEETKRLRQASPKAFPSP